MLALDFSAPSILQRLPHEKMEDADCRVGAGAGDMHRNIRMAGQGPGRRVSLSRGAPLRHWHAREGGLRRLNTLPHPHPSFLVDDDAARRTAGRR